MIICMIPGLSSLLRTNAKQTKQILDLDTTTTDAEKVQALRDLWKVYETPNNSYFVNGVAYKTSDNKFYIVTGA